jgi:murein DD-endopeptidase MepM/ murein hydrolase activator NlpD
VHGNGWVSIYGHLASFAVGNGQAVGRGQTIGYEGSTGNSTGPHLHFEIRLNDTPQNPLQYLP